MTTIGPRWPDETREQYIRRIVDAAPRPNPEQMTRLVNLLRSGKHPCSKGFAAVEGDAHVSS